MADFTLSQPSAQATPASHPLIRHFVVPFAFAVAASAFVALCAHLSIPLVFTPVPLSMAPFAVILLGLLLGPRMAFASLCLYLAEGAAGLPVFSPQGPGGILQLLGPTGGYLMSYPFATALAGYLYHRKRQTFSRGVVASGTASLVILLCGASWLKALTHMDIQLILTQAVVPFLPGDALKILVAAGTAKLTSTIRLRRQLKDFLSQDQHL
jgi:biotin transport system substrate-specific component